MTMNYQKYERDIRGDATRILKYWDVPEYYSSGAQLGFAFIELIGPITDTVDELDATATPDFINGFVYGMTGDLAISPEEIEGCYQAQKPDLLQKEL